jgi:hypothetical protein
MSLFPCATQLLLQDYDRLAPSNDSTSLLSCLRDVGRRKTRVVADWLEARGFETILEERRFGLWIKREADDPRGRYTPESGLLAGNRAVADYLPQPK